LFKLLEPLRLIDSNTSKLGLSPSQCRWCHTDLPSSLFKACSFDPLNLYRSQMLDNLLCRAALPCHELPPFFQAQILTKELDQFGPGQVIGTSEVNKSG